MFFGQFDGEPKINPEEVAAYQYLSVPAIKAEIAQFPEKYTEWFKIIFKEIDQYIEQEL